jgi:leucyl-tRNA synthetase
MAVQVNGKLRGTIEISSNENKKACEKKGLALATVKAQLINKTLSRVIIIPDKIINFIAT